MLELAHKKTAGMDGEWRYYGQAQVCSEDRQGSSATLPTTLITDLGLSIHVPMFMSTGFFLGPLEWARAEKLTDGYYSRGKYQGLPA